MSTSKACSHNPAEGTLLAEAQQKYGKLVQMGNQQRSSQHTIEVIQKIREGITGSTPPPTPGTAQKSQLPGKEAPVPAQLDWDLWQDRRRGVLIKSTQAVQLALGSADLRHR